MEESTSRIPYSELEASRVLPEQNETLTALSLLTTYNHFLLPPDVHSISNVMGGLLASLPPQPSACLPSCLPPYCHHLPLPKPGVVLTPPPCDDARRRSEKRPIPPEMKDDKYFERRKRNNQAAKKSRDARRMREDQIAWRACMLEQENASLRSYIAALRQESRALRTMLSVRDEPRPDSTAR